MSQTLALNVPTAWAPICEMPSYGPKFTIVSRDYPSSYIIFLEEKKMYLF